MLRLFWSIKWLVVWVVCGSWIGLGCGLPFVDPPQIGPSCVEDSDCPSGQCYEGICAQGIRHRPESKDESPSESNPTDSVEPLSNEKIEPSQEPQHDTHEPKTPDEPRIPDEPSVEPILDSSEPKSPDEPLVDSGISDRDVPEEPTSLDLQPDTEPTVETISEPEPSCSSTASDDTTCDGKDDDCDGRIDEDYVVKKCTNANSSSNTPCTGETRCFKGQITCVGWPVTAPEFCGDQLDNNCDGQIDEEPCVCVAGTTRLCYTGAPKTKGIGICKEGVSTCVSGASPAQNKWGPCQKEILPKASEECNDKDDDCNGKVDDIAPQTVCQLGGASGVRYCNTGTVQCSKGVATCLPRWTRSLTRRITAVPHVSSGALQPCTQALFNDPSHVLLLKNGLLLVSDRGNGTIRTIDPKTGAVTLLAGTGTSGFRDGPALQAQFDWPHGLAEDAQGNLYVADRRNHRIRKIARINNQPCGSTSHHTGWCVSTVAGANAGFKDGDIKTALFNQPSGVAVDSQGALIVADYANRRIRKVVLNLGGGRVSTIAGDGTNSKARDGVEPNKNGTTARFRHPIDVKIDSNDVIYVADWESSNIRRIRFLQQDSCGGGNQYTGYCTDTFGDAGRNNLHALALHEKQGVLQGIYSVLSGGHQIVYVSHTGRRRHYLGAQKPSVQAGFRDGLLKQGQVHFPLGLALKGEDTLYIADGTNRIFREMHLVEGWIKTFAGVPKLRAIHSSPKSGQRLCAAVDKPRSVIKDSNGNLFIADEGAHVVWRLSSKGQLEVFAGIPGKSGRKVGHRFEAELNTPRALALDTNGDLYISDSNNHCIRRVKASDQRVETVAGKCGSSGFKDHNDPNQVRFNEPHGLAFDTQGNLYVADIWNHRIRRVNPQTGSTQTFAGGGSGNLNGTRDKVRFDAPQDVLIDTQGTMFVADSGNHCVRRMLQFSLAGQVFAPFAGGCGHSGNKDGAQSSVRLRYPRALLPAANGGVFIADAGNYRIRLATGTGTVTTIAGSSRGYKEGVDRQAQFGQTAGMVVDFNGDMILLDPDNKRIRILPKCR